MTCAHTCHNIVVLGVQEFIDLGQTAFHIPQHDQPQRGCCCCLALVLVLEDPVHSVCAVALRIQCGCIQCGLFVST